MHRLHEEAGVDYDEVTRANLAEVTARVLESLGRYPTAPDDHAADRPGLRRGRRATAGRAAPRGRRARRRRRGPRRRSPRCSTCCGTCPRSSASSGTGTSPPERASAALAWLVELVLRAAEAGEAPPESLTAVQIRGRMLSPIVAGGSRCGLTSCWPRPRERAGLSDFGDDSFREGLDRLVHSMRPRRRSTSSARWRCRSCVTRLLTTRLQVEDWYRRHPEIDDEPIDAPLIGLGPAPDRLDGALLPARRGPGRPVAAALGVEPAVPAAVDRRAARSAHRRGRRPGWRCRRR